MCSDNVKLYKCVAVLYLYVTELYRPDTELYKLGCYRVGKLYSPVQPCT